VILDFWIITNEGTCIFHRSNEDEKNPEVNASPQVQDTELFSGVLSAILAFHAELTKGNIRKIEDENSKFLFFKEKNLFFIVRAKLGISEKKIIKKVESARKFILDEYKIVLETFNGNMEVLRGFTEEMDRILKEKPKTKKWGEGLLDL
jgi:hypothetical protein